MANDQLQDVMLDLLKKDKISVKVYFVNGVQMNGVVRTFDDYIILVEDEKR